MSPEPVSFDLTNPDDQFMSYDAAGNLQGEVQLQGKYVIWDCVNELESRELFTHFKNAEEVSSGA